MAKQTIGERKPKAADFVGKTIRRVNTRSCDIWRIYFTDGSAIAIEAEVENTEFGGIPVMQVCESCVKPSRQST